MLCIDRNADALLWRLRLIEAARERIVLTTFDFRDDRSGQDIMAALLHAARRGVRVQILVDGMNGTLWLPGSAHFQELAAQEGVEVKLYNPLTLLRPWRNNYRMHTKAILVGDRVSVVGSCNLDMRSVYLDTEMMLRIDCPELNASLRAHVEELQEHSRHVSPDGAVTDGSAYQPVEQGLGKKIIYAVLRVLILPFRHLL